MPKLNFYYGAMDSGKSTNLLQAAHSYESKGNHVLVAKPSIDTKGDKRIVSRLGIEREADFLITPDMNVTDEILRQQEIKKMGEVACVLFDEAQFLQVEQADQIWRFTKNKKYGAAAIAYGLLTDFRGEIFPASDFLFGHAEHVERLKTMCRCGQQAIFQVRKINDEVTFDGGQVAIDGENKVTYESVCGSHFIEEQDKYSEKDLIKWA